jgi:ribosomal protein S18 acetylase RimI-like enzyme
MSSLVIRKALPTDRDFLIKAILEADKSNTAISSYASLLNMQEPDLKKLFEDIFEEELEGCEFGHENFAVITEGNDYAATVASWIEGADSLPSWQIKSTALYCCLPKEHFEMLRQLLDNFSSINIERTIGALQIESVYVENSFRGRGLFKELLNFHIQSAKDAGFEFDTIELLTYNSNHIAEAVYTKAGFVKVKSSISDHPEILHYYPGSGMNLWQKSI